MAEELVASKLTRFKANISDNKRKYLEDEAAIARDPSDPRNLNPVFPHGAKVVCVGCGGGWEGEALGTSRFVAVDVDEEVREFRLERDPDGEFLLAGGEKLPLRDEEFTFYMARGCCMYMDLRKFFSEAFRVLADDGYMWFTCHDFDHEWQHLRRSFSSFRFKDVIYRTYVILNGFLYHFLGTLVRFPPNRSRTESFQTKSGIRRGLRRAGFSDIQFPKTKPGIFLVTARKQVPAAAQ